MTDIESHIKEQLSLLPSEPGVYRFLDGGGVVIYVGKAKNLKKRVSSYFVSRADHNRKVKALVRNIKDIVHTVVPTEADAFLLENSMIKSLQPKYNILLKDDKTYPWIVVTNEPYPRIRQTRKVVRDGSQYFGPYASVSMQKSVQDLVMKLYSIRSCNLRLTPEAVKSRRFDLCLEYHIGNCKAPCVEYISQEEYKIDILAAVNILKGNMKEAETYLTQRMNTAADALRFEEAAFIKERLRLLDNYTYKSTVVTTLSGNIDVFSLVIDGSAAYCNYMFVAKGAIINSYTVEMRLGVDEGAAEVLAFAINRVCDNLDRTLSPEVVVPFEPEGVFEGVTFTVPRRGDKLKLLDLSERNCRLYRLERMKQLERINPENHANMVMERMKKDLMLPREPRYIECFDNSNIQGAYPVSSCVVFRDGKPSKKDYRHFNIKTVVGIDDFASMEETLTRRYKRLLEDNQPLPDLIVVDGGKGQLSSAYSVLIKLGIAAKVPIIGLAKRLEEVFFPHDSDPYYIDKNSDTLKVLMYIRDEAHRFGITFHRNKRSKGFIKSELEDIPSLGQQSIEKLLKAFRSVKGVKEVSQDDLSKVIGAARAQKIIEYFESKK